MCPQEQEGKKNMMKEACEGHSGNVRQALRRRTRVQCDPMPVAPKRSSERMEQTTIEWPPRFPNSIRPPGSAHVAAGRAADDSTTASNVFAPTSAVALLAPCRLPFLHARRVRSGCRSLATTHGCQDPSVRGAAGRWRTEMYLHVHSALLSQQALDGGVGV